MEYHGYDFRYPRVDERNKENRAKWRDDLASTAWKLANESNVAFGRLQNAQKRPILLHNSAAVINEEREMEQTEDRVGIARERFEVLSAMAAPAMLMVDSPFSAGALDRQWQQERENYEKTQFAHDVLNAYANMRPRADQFTEIEADTFRRLESNVDDTLDVINERQASVIRGRLGMNDSGVRKTFYEIGQEHGVTGERIKSIIVQARASLRHPLKLERLTSGIDKAEIVDQLPGKPIIALLQPNEKLPVHPR
jgi:hypothetical protein